MKTEVSAGILVAALFCALVSPPVVAQGNPQARVLTKAIGGQISGTFRKSFRGGTRIFFIRFRAMSFSARSPNWMPPFHPFTIIKSSSGCFASRPVSETGIRACVSLRTSSFIPSACTGSGPISGSSALPRSIRRQSARASSRLAEWI
jgi:hypothetical protein